MCVLLPGQQTVPHLRRQALRPRPLLPLLAASLASLRPLPSHLCLWPTADDESTKPPECNLAIAWLQDGIQHEDMHAAVCPYSVLRC